MAAGLPPSGAQALTKVEVMILALPKRTASQFTKMETEKKKPKKKKKKKPIRLQSLWGGGGGVDSVSKGSLHALETNPRSPVSAY